MTTAILNKPTRIFLAALVLVVMLFPISSVNATNATLLSDTMTRQKVSQLSSHTISMKLSASETLATGETIIFDFGTAGFALDVATTSDATLNDGTARGAPVAAGAAPACSAGANNWTLTTNTTTDVVTITTCASWTASGASPTVTLTFGVAAGGTDRLTNPGSSGSKKIAVTGSYGDDATSFAVPILTEDQVTVSATVDPSVTSTLSATTCSLGILSSGAINFCSYTNTVSTNASSGYVSTIVENGNLCSPSVAVCTNDINDTTGDGDIDEGTEEYGVSSNDTVGTQAIVDSTGCDDSGIAENATAITGTAQVYADSGDGDAGPVSGAVTTVCHSASILGSTPAGTYSHIVTHITTGTF